MAAQTPAAQSVTRAKSTLPKKKGGKPTRPGAPAAACGATTAGHTAPYLLPRSSGQHGAWNQQQHFTAAAEYRRDLHAPTHLPMRVSRYVASHGKDKCARPALLAVSSPRGEKHKNNKKAPVLMALCSIRTAAVPTHTRTRQPAPAHTTSAPAATSSRPYAHDAHMILTPQGSGS